MVRALLDSGSDVISVDNLSSGSLDNFKDLGIKPKNLMGDLRNYDFALEAIRGVETVYHFAAEVGSVQYLHGSKLSELSALESNIVIDANVFRACRENKVGSIIYASSVSVYPIDEQQGSEVTFLEEDSTRKINPEGGYGWSKYLGEIQLSLMEGVQVGVARIFHAYGPNIYLRPDRSQVIGSLIRKAILYPKEPYVVWGNGAQRRCFAYVDEVIVALLFLNEYISKHDSLTVNIGSQEEVSVRELAQKIARISGKEMEIVFDPSKPTGALSRKPDLTRVREKLGWAPTTQLDRGLSTTYDWARSRLGIHRTL
jgi:nucleoside-diphosphate-sugar epimerase